MHRHFSHRFIFFTALITVASTTTSDQIPPSTQIQPVDEAAESSPQPDPQAVAAMSGALTKALAAGWQDLHLVVRCPAHEQSDSLEVFGDGVGIWNMERQLSLPREVLQEMLSTLQSNSFAAMPYAFGGKAKPLQKRTKTPPAGAEIACQIALELDGSSKTVIQMRKGEQSAELRKLAEHLLSLARPHAEEGLTASGLQDALDKVAKGDFAPVLFGLSVHQKPMGGQEGEGWVLSIRRMEAQARSLAAGSGDLKAVTVSLDSEMIQSLARLLGTSRVAEMPANVWAEVYTDFGVGVMRWRKSIQARQFDGMKPEDLGEQQEAFDALIAELDKLYQQVSGSDSSAKVTAPEG
jgi:hypothetical protein